MPVAQQLAVTVANRPGALARVAELLASNKINITGLYSSGPSRQIRLLVSNPAKARRVLVKAGLPTRLEDVVVVSLPERVGTLARTARRLAQRKININYGYATLGRGAKRATLVLGVKKPRQAARLAG